MVSEDVRTYNEQLYGYLELARRNELTGLRPIEVVFNDGGQPYSINTSPEKLERLLSSRLEEAYNLGDFDIGYCEDRTNPPKVRR